ncbi:MAG: glycosyltransferase, partial [Actinomycetota bacterium]
PVDRAILAQWYRAADLVAVPSHSESFGLVALEAQASGTPVVAAAVGGLPFAVGDAGLIINGHQPADWSAALGGLLENPDRRADLSRLGVEHASAFSWERTTDRLLEVYAESMLARTGSPIEDASDLVGVPAAVIP